MTRLLQWLRPLRELRERATHSPRTLGVAIVQLVPGVLAVARKDQARVIGHQPAR